MSAVCAKCRLSALEHPLSGCADLNPEIGFGLRRREPAIDFRPAAGIIAHGTSDPEVLEIASQTDRVLVSRDVSTMPRHFERFIERHDSPGLLLIPSSRSTGEAIQGILMVWLIWDAEDLRNLIRWLPRP